MGTQIEDGSYMHSYYAMKNLNVDPKSSWSKYYEEKTSSGQLCNGFLPHPGNGYPQYDKEMLKHTMLEHEAIFRQQVYELHRVYKIQRELMEEYQNRELHRYSIPADASQTSSFSSQMPPEGAKMIWQMPSIDTYGKSPVVGPDCSKPSFNFLKEASVHSSANGITSSEILHKSRINMFDLELPAELYLENENGERSEKDSAGQSSKKAIDFLGITCDRNPEDDAKLPLCMGEDPRRQNEGNLKWSENNLIGDKVGNLQKPIALMNYSGAADSAIGGPIGPNLNRLSARSGPGTFGSHRDYFRDRHADDGTSSNFFAANEKIKLGNPLVNKENGKCTGSIDFFIPKFCDVELQKSSKLLDVKVERSNHILLSEQNSAFDRFAWKNVNGAEVSSTNNASRFNYSDHSSRAIPALFPGPPIDHRIVYPLFSSAADPRSSIYHISTASQHPVSGSYLQHPLRISTKLKDSSAPAFGTLASQSTKDFPDAKCKINLNLNQSLPDGLEDGLTALAEHEEPASEILWLKRKLACDDHVGLKKSGKAFGYADGIDRDLEGKNGKEAGMFLHNLSDSTSTSVSCRFQKDGASQDTDMRILGFHVHNETQESLVAQQTVKKVGTLIDLNDELPEEDNSESSVVLHGCQLLLQNGSVKPVFEIDLEAPICQEEDVLQSLQESKPSSKLDGSLDKECPLDSFAIAAAKNIVAMSVEIETSLEKTGCWRASPRQFGTLQWFAEIASSNTENCAAQGQVGNCNSGSSGDDESDSFESLTLKLEETKIHEHLCRPKTPENEEETDYASLLLTKPRRGRRRQKKDFQRDILPGLATLSRHEVTDDFQIIGGLIQATGGSWHMGSGRQRGRKRGQTKARRQPKSSAVTVVEEVPVSPPVKPISADLEADGLSVIGWGRTTRRCRRQRYPLSSTPATSQVP